MQPNEHGVYMPSEVIELPRAVKGWRGGPLAEIMLADLGSHWIWATGFQLWGSDCWGSFSPLVDFDAHQALTRETAIEQAAASIRKKVGSRAAECRDAAAIVAWLDTLMPAQLDMFGAAA